MSGNRESSNQPVSLRAGIGDHFGRFAQSYDAGRRKLIPQYEDFYSTAVDVATLRAPAVPTGRILDLGAGTGLLSALMTAAQPGAHVTLFDASTKMMALAPQRLGETASRATFVVGDFATGLPDGPFDAVVSALAIHHLVDNAKQRLYERIFERLTPGGVFVNAEQVAGPSAALDADYKSVWEVQTRRRGATAQDLAEAAERMSVDRCASVDDQCQWLRNAGFVDVDVFFKAWRFAVFGGWRLA